MGLLEKKVKSHYNLIAPLYDFLHHLQTLYADTLHRKLAIKRLIKLNPRTCLEIGCGTGLTTQLLFKQTKSIKVNCLDSSENMMNFAKERAVRNAYEKYVSFFNSSIYSIPLDDNSIDCIISVYVFGGLFEPLQAIKEMKRVLNVNGHVVLAEMTQPPVESNYFNKIIYKALVKPWVRFFWKFIDHPYKELFESNG